LNNQTIGILTILICCIGYFYSWKNQRKENFKLSLFLLLVCGSILRLFTASDLFLHTWDEQFHALVAKNLIHHPLTPTLYDNPILPYDFTNWTGNHIWVHKQPLPLWTMAASMWAFGVNEIALRLPSIILSTIAIYLTYFIGTYFFGRKTGYIAAFLFSINGLIIELTAGRVATDHVDVFFLFFIELGIYFSIFFVTKRHFIYTILVGVSIGLAILCKWLPALIVIPVWFLLLVNSKKFPLKVILFHGLTLVIVCAAVFLPWQIYINNVFPLESSWEAGFNFKHLTEALSGQGGPFYYYLDKIRINYGELIYLPFGWLIWKTIKNRHDLRYSALLIWIILPLLFFSFAATKMQGYILFISPALFIVTGEFMQTILQYKGSLQSTWMIYFIAIAFIVLPVRYSIERTKPFQDLERSPEWVKNLKSLRRQNIKKGILFNYNEPIMAMFYTDFIAYRNIPSKNILDSLRKKGHNLIIVRDENLPVEIKEMSEIQFINLKQPK
jgi:4-amino-4-deoxy-L-arabinose transferase-like glycosyltransferase